MVTLGCRMNLAESERIHAMLADERDVVVVNSCAVTSEAVRQTRQAIRRARRERPDARLLVTGCAAEIERDAIAAMPEVDGLVANSAKLDPRAWNVPPSRLPAAALHSRAFIAVQQGCDHACTFCVIPQGRGPSRSLSVSEVLRAIEADLQRGAGEVVLTGIDLTSWGADLPDAPPLGTLVSSILGAFPALRRLRLSSVDGIEIDPLLEEAIAGEPRVMPHVHLSLQHGHDLILKRMKRRHLRGDAAALVERLRARRPEIAIGADLIAGFPTESDEHHAANLSIVRELGIVHGHVFPYSPRPGTPAARMPQVDRAVVRARAAELRAAVAEVRNAWLEAHIGMPLAVLAERDGTGHAPDFARVRLPESVRPGEIATITPTSYKGRPARMSDTQDRSWTERLFGGFRKTSERLSENLTGVVGTAKLDDATLDDVEDALIVSDLGPAAARRIRDKLAEKRFGLNVTERELKEAVADEIAAILRPVARPLEITAFPRPQVILVIGVNGSGKTTTIAKLAHWLTEEDYEVMLAAGDTFRAAAIGQLATWAERVGVPIVKGPEGGDPASIVFDAVKEATATGIDALVVDTAGRLQNKRELMDELAKIRRVLGRLNPEAPHDVILVLDATNGQNALSQIEIFKEVAGVTGLVMTKLDGTARGGVLVAAAEQFGLPIHAIGVGEKLDDLRPFDPDLVARVIAGVA